MPLTKPDSEYVGFTPVSTRQLVRAEVAALASCYWPAGEVVNAVAVADLESVLWTSAWNRDGEDSRGIWQVNVGPGAHPELAIWNLFDPQINAYFAHQIWRASGWRAWYNSAKALGLI